MAYCCDHCKKIIDPEDIEAIEVKQPVLRTLFSNDDFVPAKRNVQNDNQHVHYCGECKMDYLTEWIA
ncbi:hypothetical protein [Bacillus cereus group sp. Bce040]